MAWLFRGYLFVVLSGICVPSVHAQAKIAYIDFQYLISQVQSVEDVRIELERLSKEWTDRIETMQDSVDDIEKNLETMSITLTKTGKNVLEKNVLEAKQKISAYQEQKFSPATGELYKKQQALLQPLIDKIKRAVDNVRLHERYDVIFDISTGNPVSIDKKYDVTGLVLDEFNAVGLTARTQDQTSGRGLPNTKAPVKANPATPVEKERPVERKDVKKDLKKDDDSKIDN